MKSGRFGDKGIGGGNVETLQGKTRERVERKGEKLLFSKVNRRRVASLFEKGGVSYCCDAGRKSILLSLKI